MEKEILVSFLETLSISTLFTSSARFSEFDTGNSSLFQIKVFDRNIKETTLASYSQKKLCALVLRD